eukprot:scaffold16169_cov62-Cyclotella_meneghiniana.AAC.2
MDGYWRAALLLLLLLFVSSAGVGGDGGGGIGGCILHWLLLIHFRVVARDGCHGLSCGQCSV